jgi:hypothetical protein
MPDTESPEAPGTDDKSTGDPLPVVYGDEAGNTGPELLDPNQPVFALAFTDLTRDEAQSVLATIDTAASEVHVADLLRREGGATRLRKFFDHPLMTRSRVRTNVTHKEHMVVTKIVDLLIENVAHSLDFDLYRDGLNIVLGNRIYAVLHELVDTPRRLAFLRSFVAMARRPDDTTIETFYREAAELRQAIDPRHHEVCDEFFVPLFFSQGIVRKVFDGSRNDRYTLDPIIPTAFVLAYEWAQTHPQGFKLIHDDAKTLRLKEPELRLFMSERLAGVEVGYDERKHPARLPIRELAFATSHSEPSIQVADVVAGVTMRAFAARAQGRTGAAVDSLIALSPQRFLTGGIWPTDDFTPEALGMKFQGGVHPINAYPALLADPDG